MAVCASVTEKDSHQAKKTLYPHFYFYACPVMMLKVKKKTLTDTHDPVLLTGWFLPEGTVKLDELR